MNDYMAAREVARIYVCAEVRERLEKNRELAQIPYEAKACLNCRKFHQHYVLNPKGAFLPIWRGHCSPHNKGFEYRDWRDNCEEFESLYVSADGDSCAAAQ